MFKKINKKIKKYTYPQMLKIVGENILLELL